MKATDVIKRDHRAAEELFERHKKANQDAREAMEKKIFDAFDAHESMEDEYFYPALDGALDADPAFEALEREQGELKMGVAALRLVPFLDRTEAVKMTFEKVLDHAKREEAEILPRAEELLGPEKLEELGAKMEPLSAVANEK